jgi:Fe-S-cluster containining protein
MNPKHPPENNLTVTDTVTDIYKWIDSVIEADNSSLCQACGNCCDFKTFGHRLYVTTPEMVYFANSLPPSDLKPMSTGLCPYNIEGKCTVYTRRFAGCRIFSCRGNSDLQSQLSEQAIQKFKNLCNNLDIPYRYVELSVALNELASQKPSIG